VLLGLPFALVLMHRLALQSPGPGLNGVLADTARLQLGYSLLLVAGLLL
jgi:hypothetical protein